MLLKGKSVFITGGTGGIGAPLVELLREAGARVRVYERRTDGDLIDNLVPLCQELAQNTPDILINMAGVNEFNRAEDQDYESINLLNLLVPMRICQAVLPGMKRRGSGQIVNVGSMTGLIPLPHFSGYASAKAGLKAFSDALRRELGGSGIAVTMVLPRAVRTPMNSGACAEINARTHVNYDDPEVVAARIFKAIRRREREVRFGWPERIFAFLNANLPALIDLGLRKNSRIGEEILTTNAPEKGKDYEQKNIPVPGTAS
ncbi:MAG: short-chain dehydrogenase [Desulfuromonas sp.]|nr:MAG: short-chain dehydrogenase [Desulfuromonas sp.]